MGLLDVKLADDGILKKEINQFVFLFCGGEEIFVGVLFDGHKRSKPGTLILFHLWCGILYLLLCSAVYHYAVDPQCRGVYI